MSFKAFVWAWDQPLAKDEHLIVLLALADIANDAGLVRASQAYIAKKARKTERTVRRALVAMLGTTISVEERPGRVDYIRLNIPDEFTVKMGKDQEHEAGKRGRPRKPLTSGAENGGHHGIKAGAQESDDPKTEPEEGTKSVVLSAPAPFDEWWAIYPRKAAKVEARKAWGQMLGPLNALTLAVLLERTRAFADHVVGKDPDKIAHPATWLRGERWNDELPDRSQTDGRRQPAGATDYAAERDGARLEALVDGARQAAVPRRRRWGI